MNTDRIRELTIRFQPNMISSTDGSVAPCYQKWQPEILSGKILLEGAFGSYIDKTNAMRIGMIPDIPLANVFAVGNSAGDGARIALLNVEKRLEAERVAARVTRYELPADPGFQNDFIQAMNFPTTAGSSGNKS